MCEENNVACVWVRVVCVLVCHNLNPDDKNTWPLYVVYSMYVIYIFSHAQLWSLWHQHQNLHSWNGNFSIPYTPSYAITFYTKL